MEQDQILLPAKNEVLDFFWRGYRPGKYPFLEKKSENLPSEIKPNISSNPVIISFFIEKKASEKNFNEIPNALRSVLKFLKEIQSDENPAIFFRKLFPVFRSLLRIQISYTDIPSYTMAEQLKILDSLDKCIAEMPSEKSNHFKEILLFYIRANRILYLQKSELNRHELLNIQDPFSPSQNLKVRYRSNNDWEIRSNDSTVNTGFSLYLPLHIETQVFLGYPPVIKPDLYRLIEKLWDKGKLIMESGIITLLNCNGDLIFEKTTATQSNDGALY